MAGPESFAWRTAKESTGLPDGIAAIFIYTLNHLFYRGLHRWGRQVNWMIKGAQTLQAFD